MAGKPAAHPSSTSRPFVLLPPPPRCLAALPCSYAALQPRALWLQCSESPDAYLAATCLLLYLDVKPALGAGGTNAGGALAIGSETRNGGRSGAHDTAVARRGPPVIFRRLQRLLLEPSP